MLDTSGAEMPDETLRQGQSIPEVLISCAQLTLGRLRHLMLIVR